MARGSRCLILSKENGGMAQESGGSGFRDGVSATDRFAVSPQRSVEVWWMKTEPALVPLRCHPAIFRLITQSSAKTM